LKIFKNEGESTMENIDRRKIMAKKLSRVRKAHHLTQEQVADILKIKRSTYAYYERNTTPPLENILKLSTLFHVSTHELMYNEQDPVIIDQFLSQSTFLDGSNIFDQHQPKNFGDLLDRERMLMARYRLLPENLKDKICKEVEELAEKIEQ